MARVEMRPADLDHIPCLFCRVQSFPDGSSPRKYTISHGQHRLDEVFAICDDCAIELEEALAMGERLASEQYLVGRQARPIRNLLYRLTTARQALTAGGEAAERATQDLLEILPAQADEIAKLLEGSPIGKEVERS
ncbi:MAG: hypothetical protein M0Z66_01795 [Thermaerobacter sp.]|nr:hypothetical protein [Thermaerobacter sp.]